jgi:hypothetical protein
MAVHPAAATVEQDRAVRTGADRLVDGPADGWRQRDQDDLRASAAYVQHPVTVFFAEVGDIRASVFPREKLSGTSSDKRSVLPSNSAWSGQNRMRCSSLARTCARVLAGQLADLQLRNRGAIHGKKVYGSIL